MNKPQHGFTIIETMIVLAVSGAMFTIAFYGTRGTQDNVAFRQSMNATELKIKEIFNNVDNGYFGNSGNYSCAVGGGGAIAVIQDNNGGGNSGACVFLGKILSFTYNSSDITIDTLVGDRTTDPQAPANNEASPGILQEIYTMDRGVKYTGTTKKIAAVRDRNDSGGSNIRALRKIESTPPCDKWACAVSINPPAISNQLLCFSDGGSKNGSITITPTDLVVDYNGTGC